MTQELRKLAEAATQGPWIAGDDEDSDYYLVGPPSFGTVVTNPVVQLHALNNAEFIAAANPAAILELIDRVEKAEKDAARLDWLEKHDKRYYNYDKISCIVGSGFSHGFISEGVNSTLRDAIDAAMEASK